MIVTFSPPSPSPSRKKPKRIRLERSDPILTEKDPVGAIGSEKDPVGAIGPDPKRIRLERSDPIPGSPSLSRPPHPQSVRPRPGSSEHDVCRVMRAEELYESVEHDHLRYHEDL